MELVLRVWQNLDKMRITVGGVFDSLKCCHGNKRMSHDHMHTVGDQTGI